MTRNELAKHHQQLQVLLLWRMPCKARFRETAYICADPRAQANKFELRRGRPEALPMREQQVKRGTPPVTGEG
jgi:hypothetical protein